MKFGGCHARSPLVGEQYKHDNQAVNILMDSITDYTNKLCQALAEQQTREEQLKWRLNHGISQAEKYGNKTGATKLRWLYKEL